VKKPLIHWGFFREGFYNAKRKLRDKHGIELNADYNFPHPGRGGLVAQFRQRGCRRQCPRDGVALGLGEPCSRACCQEASGSA